MTLEEDALALMLLQVISSLLIISCINCLFHFFSIIDSVLINYDLACAFADDMTKLASSHDDIHLITGNDLFGKQ